MNKRRSQGDAGSLFVQITGPQSHFSLFRVPEGYVKKLTGLDHILWLLSKLNLFSV